MMQEENRLKLHSLIIAIKDLSDVIDLLKSEREVLLEEFLAIQLNDKKLSVVK